MGISERGVSALASRNELPAGFGIGGLRRWDWAEVVHYLKSEVAENHDEVEVGTTELRRRDKILERRIECLEKEFTQCGRDDGVCR